MASRQQLVPLALACVALLWGAGAQGTTGSGGNSTGETEACQNAIAAQKFYINTLAAILQRPMPYGGDDSLEPDSDFLTRAKMAFAARMIQRPSNLVNVFTGATPYSGWGNGVFQTALSQAVHVPSATLGEMMYASNTVVERYVAAAMAAAAKNSTVPNTEAWELWAAPWQELANQLYAGSQTMDDTLNKRAMLLRSLMYTYVAHYPRPTAPDYYEGYSNASKMFREAMEHFPAYQTNFFTFPFDNGTAKGNLQAFLVTATPKRAAPLMIFLGSVYTWKEVVFMRYGLAALRRNYAVLFLDQPGQGYALRDPPHFGSCHCADQVVANVLDTLQEDKELTKLVDFDQVIVSGISIGSTNALLACTKLSPERVHGCVFNPGMHSLPEAVIASVGRRSYVFVTDVALEDNSAFPDPNLAAMFLDPAEKILRPLLTECSADSEAPALFSATMRASTDPELMYSPVTMLGMINGTYDELMDNVWGALRKINDEYAVDTHEVAAPILIMGGEEDTVTGGQEKQLFVMLNQTGLDHRFHYFPKETGASLGSQIGAVTYWEQAVFPWASDILDGKPQAAGK